MSDFMDGEMVRALDFIGIKLGTIADQLVQLNDRVEDAVLFGLPIQQAKVNSRSEITKPWVIDKLT